jgi:hypothetical protein
VRNSSLVEDFRAENVTGLKHTTEAAGLPLYVGVGRGALPVQRSRTVRFCGALGSENAGMSSDNSGENPEHRKPKVSYATLIAVG